MSFAWPQLLWLLLVPVALLAWELTRRRIAAAAVRPKILQAAIGAQALHLQRNGTRVAASRTRPWLLLGLTFAIVALARPQWGRLEEPVFDQSREILIAIDLSRSMLATDIKPSRLDRAKLLIQSLLEKLKGERVGLVVFSGTAFLQSPLSSDYEILREFLPAMKPDFLPEGGTNYEAMLATSLEAFTASASADRFLIVLSDGEALDENWRSRAEELKKKSVRVIALGVGTPNGSMIPDGSGGLVKDERGAVVLSKLEGATLQQLAETTNGVYHDASAWIDLASLIDQTVNAGRKGSFAEKNTVRMVERFQWPLALALWCLLVSFYYEFPVRPRTRDIALAGHPSNKRTTATSSAVPPVLPLALLLLAALTVAPSDAHAAVKVAPPATPSSSSPPPTLQPGLAPSPLQPPATATPGTPASAPPEPPALGKIVSRLSQKDTLTSPDLSELAHETVNWGRRIKEQGQPVPEGPVRDALAAVDQLEKKGDKATDWSQLRRELEQLLEKPEEKKQNQQNQSDQPQQQNKDQQQNGKNDQSNQQNKPNQSPQQQKQDQSSASQKQNEQKSPSADDKKSNEPQKGDDAHNEGSRGDQKKSEAKPSQSLAFGDMKKEPPPPPSSETQKVGGATEKKEKAEPIDPALARPMEKLEELKSQDAPADLFRMLQADQNQSSQKKSGKNW